MLATGMRRRNERSYTAMSRDRAQLFCVAPMDRASSDPTGTMDIRRKFGEAVSMRFRKVKTLLQGAIVSQDLLGLHPGATTPVAMASPSNKESHFTTWLRQLLVRIVAEGDGTWLRPMLQMSYNRAIKRARRLTKSDALPHDTQETIDA